MKGKIRVADDFCAPIKVMKEYMDSRMCCFLDTQTVLWMRENNPPRPKTRFS